MIELIQKLFKPELPRTFLIFLEIRNISFDDKKFIIKAVDRSNANFTFYSKKLRVSQQLFDHFLINDCRTIFLLS